MDQLDGPTATFNERHDVVVMFEEVQENDDGTWEIDEYEAEYDVVQDNIQYASDVNFSGGKNKLRDFSTYNGTIYVRGRVRKTNFTVASAEPFTAYLAIDDRNMENISQLYNGEDHTTPAETRAPEGWVREENFRTVGWYNPANPTVELRWHVYKKDFAAGTHAVALNTGGGVVARPNYALAALFIDPHLGRPSEWSHYYQR